MKCRNTIRTCTQSDFCFRAFHDKHACCFIKCREAERAVHSMGKSFCEIFSEVADCNSSITEVDGKIFTFNRNRKRKSSAITANCSFCKSDFIIYDGKNSAYLFISAFQDNFVEFVCKKCNKCNNNDHTNNNGHHKFERDLCAFCFHGGISVFILFNSLCWFSKLVEYFFTFFQNRLKSVLWNVEWRFIAQRVKHTHVLRCYSMLCNLL